MNYYNKDTDKEVMQYQRTGDGTQLLKKYANFIQKYYQLLTTGDVNFQNYDIRMFLSYFIPDPALRKELRRGKYHSKRCKKEAKAVAEKIRQVFSELSKEEILHELIILFLKCAKKYKQKGTTFSKYLYKTYRNDLKEKILELRKQNKPKGTVYYFDPVYRNQKQESEDQLIKRMDAPFHIELDEDLALNHPLWLTGYYATNPFRQLTREERLILAKYYYEKCTDKEIGRLLGRNPKSIHRIRKKLIAKLENMARRGEIKWIRWQRE
jgi:DNA-directed RNA polymerase specialized sigma24 family protein